MTPGLSFSTRRPQWKNIIIGDNYRIVGIIDWDRYFAASWEAFASLPKSVFHVPHGMDAPSRYDENGDPADFKTIKQCARINEYTAAVKRAEDKKGIVPRNSSYCLSQALKNTKRHNVASAMGLFVDGKMGIST